MRRILLILVSILIIITVIILATKRSKTIDLVVSRYAEDLNWLNELDLKQFRRIIVYNKGPKITQKEVKKMAEIIELPNVGRCDHTYLYHIITNYDKLSDVTIFLTASCSMDYKWENAKRTIDTALRTYDSVFVGSHHTDVAKEMANFKLDEWKSSESNNAQNNPETKLLPSPERPFGVWYKKNFGSTQVNAVVYHGIFAVSKRHIRQRSLKSYKELIRYLDTHSNPEVGHYFERAWLAIFDPVEQRCINPKIK